MSKRMKAPKEAPTPLRNALLALALVVLCATVALGIARTRSLETSPTVIARAGDVTAYQEGANGPTVIVDRTGSTKDVSLSAQELLYMAASSDGGSSRYLFSRTVDGWPMAAYTVGIPYGQSLSYRIGHRTLTLDGPGRIESLTWVDQIGGLWTADVFIPDTSTATITQALRPVVSFSGASVFPSEMPLHVSPPVFNIPLAGGAKIPIGETYFPLGWHESRVLPAGFTWPGLTDAQTWHGPEGTWMVIGRIDLPGRAAAAIRSDPSRTLGIVPGPRVSGWQVAPVTFYWDYTMDFTHLSDQAPTDTVSLMHGSRIIQAAGLYPFESGPRLLAVAIEGPKRDFGTPSLAPWRIPVGWLYPDLTGGGLWPETGEIF